MMLGSPRRVGLVLFCAVVLVGCGGNASNEAAPVDSAPVESSDDPVGDTDAQATETATPTASPAPSSASTSTVQTPVDLSSLSGVSAIEIVSPTEGVGERPLLSWSEVTGVDRYELIVADAEGIGYWAWGGEQSEVWFGGSSVEPPAASPGPLLYEPMTLTVIGLNADGQIVASSPPTPMAP